ncbi:hypothetical protein GQ42DRAFT_111131, partial [Ramicandelaber brevisporus]
FGIRSKARQLRFAEQGWYTIYYNFQFLYGVLLAYMSPYWLNLDPLFSDYQTHGNLSYAFKFYYLMCTSFAVHCFVALHLEQKRKDYSQQIAHHIATATLLTFSYYYDYVRVGHCIQMVCDAADTLLSPAKWARAAWPQWPAPSNVLFGMFVAVWVVSRHGLFSMLWWHTIVETWAHEENRYPLLFMYVFMTTLTILFVMWSMAIFRILMR